MRNTRIIVTLLLFPVFVFSQTQQVKPALDECPTWNSKPKHSSKADYLNYLSKREDNKPTQAVTNEDYATTTRSQKKIIIKPSIVVDKTKSENEKGVSVIEQKETPIAAAPESKSRLIATSTQQTDTASNVDKSDKKVDIAPLNNEKQKQGFGSANAEKKEVTIKKGNKFKKKLTRIFTRTNNKIAKPNYKKCATEF